MSIIPQIALILAALAIYAIRFALEFIYCISGDCKAEGDGGDFPQLTISVAFAVSIVVAADLLPIVALIVCMWVNIKG